MIQVVQFSLSDRQVTVHFSSQRAELPVRMRQQNMHLVPWGRRVDEPGNLPLGGWARLESIYKAWWEPYFPKPVKLPLQRVLVTDIEGHSEWCNLTKGQWVQGLVARYEHERRVYLVTLTPMRTDTRYETWPRIRV